MSSGTDQGVIRLKSQGFHLPGEPIRLADVHQSAEMVEIMDAAGQEFTYHEDGSSTDLALAAAHDALEKAGVQPSDIGLIISAPTLLTSYGLEIPAVALRAELGAVNAECLNIAQGCTGFMVALRQAGQFLKCEPDGGDVLVVTACKASSLTEGYTHGSFFWGDAAAAAVVSNEPGKGLSLEAYAEVSSDQDWGAMRLRHGDAADYQACQPHDDLRITVDFPDQRAQMDYIAGEQQRCDSLIDALLAKAGVGEDDIDALFMPSIGKNRMPYLLAKRPRLLERLETDFRYAHMGGVDVLFFLNAYLEAHPQSGAKLFMAMTPAFTAQWGGLIVRLRA